MKKGELIELEITDYAFEGRGISKVDGFVYFIDKSLPGDKVIAKIKKIKQNYAEASVEQILEPSPYRIEKFCNHFNTCGGCKQQDLTYEKQLTYKQEQVEDVFERIGGLSDFEILPIMKSGLTQFYRNKMEFSFADKRFLSIEELGIEGEILDRNFALGFHVPGVYDKVVDIEKCYLQSEKSNDILNFTREFFKSREIKVFSVRSGEGFLKNLVIKQSFHFDDFMVNLVTYGEDPIVEKYFDELSARFPYITTMINNISTRKSSVAIGEYEKVYKGSGFIYESIGKGKFRISANSFFQTNPLQAEALYQAALDFADFKGNEVVYDLYSGAGTIPIFISERVKYIYGFESVEPAIEDAKINIELNKIDNFKPILADLNKSFTPLIQGMGLKKPNVIIADPPRSGMNPKTINNIIELSPAKLVYISCNPATQARDIKLLVEDGYKLIKIRPVDMFPHTYHIENVALLIRE
ncbi:MAG: 23S rRNA (uracil(1939)-C(5))-methyltransferase RlmD [Melioribacteraceae bacterium]|nr:23S rRNA (uracil(1939)-C(5))-methyltransferase RlmD [Melioribacteraceae bacterium]